MKGLIFTEFMEMVETRWSFEMADAIIAESQVASGGAYTSIGIYPHEEMLALVNALSNKTHTPSAELIRSFGQHLFGQFVKAYPRFFKGSIACFHFIDGIENIIHAEVRRIYPDADLPTFEIQHTPGCLTLSYYSDRPFADLAQGLLEGCLAHFGENITLQREPAPDKPGAQARFILTKQA